MDYNYIRLENQIKALMNKNYSATSAISQIAQQIQLGNYQIYIDTVNKQFVFKYISLNNPIGIDPINNKIVNVKYINDVDISNLVADIIAGNGIEVDDQGNGVYKVGVKEGVFATTDDLSAVDNKFSEYSLTSDIAKTYATKDDLSAVDNKFSEYSLTSDIAETYTTKEYAETTYLKKCDLPEATYQFTEQGGFPYYKLKSEYITTYAPDTFYPICNILKFKLTDELSTAINATTYDLSIFKVNVRNHIMTDYDGNILNNFIIAYTAETKKI